jgi:hypothetical protein
MRLRNGAAADGQLRARRRAGRDDYVAVAFAQQRFDRRRIRLQED